MIAKREKLHNENVVTLSIVTSIQLLDTSKNILMNMCSAIESSKKYCRFKKNYIYMNIFMQILNQNNVDRRYCKTSRNQSTISLKVIGPLTILVGNRHTRRDRTRLNNTQQMYENL